MKKLINEALGNLTKTYNSIDSFSSDSHMLEENFTEWQTVESPQRLIKDFSFSDVNQMKFFINEVIDYQNEINHHVRVVLSENNVRVESRTHDIDEVTEIDSELARELDLVYRDSVDVY